MDDDASAHLRLGRLDSASRTSGEGWPSARVDQPARSAAHASPEFSRHLEPPLMSREHILHRVRTAIGRSAGQPPDAPPPVRIRVPNDDPGARIATMLARVEALAGKTYRAATPEDACAFVAAAIAGKTAVASNAPFLAECGIANLPGVLTGILDRQELRDCCATV